MSRTSSIKGSTPIVCYKDPNLNGKKIRVIGYAPVLDDLGPPNLFIPEGHTGILTGLVELATFSHEVPSFSDVIQCTTLVEVQWDDIDCWHDGFCRHGRKTYRPQCLIDAFMSSHPVPPNFLFSLDRYGDMSDCIEGQLRSHIEIMAMTPNPQAEACVRLFFSKTVQYKKHTA